MSESVDWEVRAASTEVLFRIVNERIRDLNEVFGTVTATWQVKCECSDRGCLELVDVDPDAYAELCEEPRRFVVAPDHVDRRIERIVAQHGRRYAIVEKQGRAGEIAERAFADRAASS